MKQVRDILLKSVQPSLRHVHISHPSPASLLVNSPRAAESGHDEESLTDQYFCVMQNLLTGAGWFVGDSKTENCIIARRGDEFLSFRPDAVSGLVLAYDGNVEIFELLCRVWESADMDFYWGDSVYDLSPEKISGLFDRHRGILEEFLVGSFRKARNAGELWSLYVDEIAFHVLGESDLFFSANDSAYNCFKQIFDKLLAQGKLVEVADDGMIVAA